MSASCPQSEYPYAHDFQPMVYDVASLGRTEAHIYCRQCGETRPIVDSPAAINEDSPQWTPRKVTRKRVST